MRERKRVRERYIVILNFSVDVASDQVLIVEETKQLQYNKVNRSPKGLKVRVQVAFQIPDLQCAKVKRVMLSDRLLPQLSRFLKYVHLENTLSFNRNKLKILKYKILIF